MNDALTQERASAQLARKSAYCNGSTVRRRASAETRHEKPETRNASRGLAAMQSVRARFILTNQTTPAARCMHAGNAAARTSPSGSLAKRSEIQAQAKPP